MTALVINPWIYDFAAYDLWSKPIGLFKLLHILEKLDFDIEFIDCLDRFHPSLSKYRKPKRYLNRYGDGKYLTEEVTKPEIFSSIPRRYKRYGMPRDIFLQELMRMKKPDIVFVNSGMTYWYPGPFEAIKIIKEHFHAPIVLGGIYALLSTDHARNHSNADVIFTGKTDHEVVEMINELLNSDYHPFEIADIRFYYTGYRYYQDLKYVTLRTSKGCPFRCRYCGWYRIDNTFQQHPPSAIIELITHFSGLGIENFAFYDDALVYKPEDHFLKIFEPINKKKINLRFHTPNGLHFQYIDRRVAQTMKQVGFTDPRFGLEDIGIKDRNIDKFAESVDNLLDAGYDRTEIYANVLAGIHGQTPDDVYQTIDFVAQQGVKIHLEEYSPVPGSADFAKTGLDLGDDPLLHNNTAYLLMHPIFGKEINKIKKKVKEVNRL